LRGGCQGGNELHPEIQTRPIPRCYQRHPELLIICIPSSHPEQQCRVGAMAAQWSETAGAAPLERYGLPGEVICLGEASFPVCFSQDAERATAVAAAAEDTAAHGRVVAVAHEGYLRHTAAIAGAAPFLRSRTSLSHSLLSHIHAHTLALSRIHTFTHTHTGPAWSGWLGLQGRRPKRERTTRCRPALLWPRWARIAIGSKPCWRSAAWPTGMP
jgi:hypothetical protein